MVIKVQLLTKRIWYFSLSSACKTGHFVLSRATAQFNLPFEVIPIDDNRALRQQYGLKVPVVLVNGNLVSCTRLIERQIKDALLAAGATPSSGANCS
jgi:hypothetical protein